MTVADIVEKLKEEHGLSDGSISFLGDKGFKKEEHFTALYDRLQLPDETFKERRDSRSDLDVIMDRLDAPEITDGRYARYVEDFADISSEQALIKGRLKFAVEYNIRLAELIAGKTELVERPFTNEEKAKLRSIYRNFTTKDALAIKLIERRNDHDIVAANAWLVIRGQQLGLDDNLLRGITHFGRTSADVNTNVTGELYMKAIGKWTASLAELVGTLSVKAEEYADITCVARTHGQPAQLTTLGHIYANLASQIALHADVLLQEDQLKLDGKIAGAIGTDVDIKAAFPDIDFEPMYHDLVEKMFGLIYVSDGNDQDCSNAALAQALNAMVDVGSVIRKTAVDNWLYASRALLGKETDEAESGSSAMPQKKNAYFSEGAEALTEIVDGSINAIKRMIISYREQGDLRRSITKREGFHPIRLAIIAIERITGDLNKYIPNIVAIEQEVYTEGLKIASSAVQTYLRAQGVSAAYDEIKKLVMKPSVRPDEVIDYVENLVIDGKLSSGAATEVKDMLLCVMDTGNNLRYFGDPNMEDAMVENLYAANNAQERSKLLGNAVPQSRKMAAQAKTTEEQLTRYKQ